jgi:acetamidase/formamidase
MPPSKVIKSDTFHYKWSKSHKPVLHVKPGDLVRFEVNEVASWQIKKSSRIEDLAKLDESKLYPLAGPVYIEGTAAGDALVVNIENVKTADWGWTAIIPGLGLLSEDFQEPDLYIWKRLTNAKFASFKKGIKVPLAPFCGVLGVAPKQDGFFDVMPPGKHGGNMDVRHLVRGTKLLLPVWNEGALFSTGDVHAAQGDGEVCVTAIECPGEVTVSFDLVKNAKITSPQFFTQRTISGEEFVTTGIAPDLMQASKLAVQNMISELASKTKLSRNEAYMLCSVAGNLRIHEIVDAPNWVVGFSIPRHVIGI